VNLCGILTVQRKSAEGFIWQQESVVIYSEFGGEITVQTKILLLVKCVSTLSTPLYSRNMDHEEKR